MKNNNESWMVSEARWISMAGMEQARNLYLDFARRFTGNTSEPVTLEITAVSLYLLSVNGSLIARGPAVSGPELRYYHRYEIPSELLHPGENLITVRLFHDGSETATTQGFAYGKPGLLIRATGGAEFCTDTSWRVRRSPEYSSVPSQVSRWGGYKEFYHAQRKDAWESLDYDHSVWETAIACASPLAPEFAQALALLDVPELECNQCAPARIVDAATNLGSIRLPVPSLALPAPWTDALIEFAPGEPGAAPSLTLDFGDLRVGYPEITCEGSPCIMELWYGETLEMYRCDVLHLPQNGTWKAIQRRAYRYMKIVMIAMEGPVTLKQVRHENGWYAYDKRGYLTTQETQVDRILDVTRHTQKANSSFHYEDCPMREQALWIMDMRVMSLVNYYLFGNPELTAKCLRQCFALQKEDGSLPSTGPKDNAMFHPDFLMHLIATLKEYYCHTGDKALVEELLPYARRVMDFIRTYRDETDGLLDSERSRPSPFLDWSERIEKRGKSTILNALYKCSLDDLADLETYGGDSSAAAPLRAEAAQVMASTNAQLYDLEQGVYRDSLRKGELLPTISQQANLAAIFAGFAQGECAETILKKVWDTGDYPRPYGPSYFLIVFEALAKIGRTDAIWNTIRDYWGAMLARGATTWWEVFDPDTPEWAYPHTFLGNIPTYEMDWIPISACHGWSNAPGYAIPRYLLGVDLSHVHEGRIHIQSRLPALWEQVDYAVPLCGETLHLIFRRNAGHYTTEVLEIPRGLTIRQVDASGNSR